MQRSRISMSLEGWNNLHVRIIRYLLSRQTDRQADRRAQVDDVKGRRPDAQTDRATAGAACQRSLWPLFPCLVWRSPAVGQSVWRAQLTPLPPFGPLSQYLPESCPAVHQVACRGRRVKAVIVMGLSLEMRFSEKLLKTFIIRFQSPGELEEMSVITQRSCVFIDWLHICLVVKAKSLPVELLTITIVEVSRPRSSLKTLVTVTSTKWWHVLLPSVRITFVTLFLLILRFFSWSRSRSSLPSSPTSQGNLGWTTLTPSSPMSPFSSPLTMSEFTCKTRHS